MKPERIDSLVSWMWTGAALIGIGLFLLIRGCFFTELGQPALSRGGYFVDPRIALRGAVLLFAIGAVIVVCAVVGKLRSRE
jgi:membrane protein implicated in regulation of membrane protease activity